MKGKTIRLTVLTMLLLTLLAATSFATLLQSNIGKVYADPGWLTGWSYRMKLTVKSDLVDQDLTNFPILVKLDSTFFDFNLAGINGEDIRFTSSDGTTLLKYEIERWSRTSAKAEIWVKLPSVSGTVDTDFYMYYGNTGASDAQEPANVWDSNYKMVQHLEETSGPVTDSTSYGNDGTAYNGTIRDAAGKIDGADHFDGVDDCIGVPHDDSLNLGTGDFTISVWVKFNASTASADADIVRKGNTVTGPKNYKLELVSSAISGVVYDSAGTIVTTPETYSDNNWHFAVFRRESTSIYLYVDGNLKASAGSAGRDVSNTANMGIGSKDDYKDDHFNGTIDEVRVSNTARSVAWIKASYFAMNNQLLTYPLPPSNDAWADPTCRYRIKITFKNSGSSTDLQNFPVLVVLNNTNKVDPLLYTRTNKTDIRFYNGSTLLPKETELWNTGGNSYIWVKVDKIPKSDAGYIYAYYNCSGSKNLDSPTSVWPMSEYAMIQHLEEASGNRADSTSNNNAGTPASGVSKTTTPPGGKIDGADKFDGSTSGYTSVPDADSLDFGTSSFSYSFWFYSTAGGTQDILDKKLGTATGIYAGYKLTISSESTVGFSAVLGDGVSGHNVRLDTGTDSRRGGNVWAMCTVVVNRTSQTMTIYMDGSTKTSPSWTASILSVGSVSNMRALRLGGTTNGTSNRYFSGHLDEVRISKVARSPDWIKADYLSTKNSFLAFGSPETGSRTIDSCDSGGVKKDEFTISDTVHVKGTGGYAASTTYPLYIVSDTAWTDGMNIPPIRIKSTTVTSDASGNIPTTSVWSPTLAPGKYDIIVDVTNPGVYDKGIDALDDGQVQVTAGFFVIPEYALGTILALAMCFGGVLVYRKYKHNKPKPF